MPNLNWFYDAAIPLNDQICAFVDEPVKIHSFLSIEEADNTVNAKMIDRFCPHLHGTHTECIYHIKRTRNEDQNLLNIWNSINPIQKLTTIVLSVESEIAENATSKETLPPTAVLSKDRIITASNLKREVEKLCVSSIYQDGHAFDAICIRTRPDNGKWKLSHKWRNSNSPYFTQEAARFIAEELKVKHWLVDTPSVDRMEDDGCLLCHKTFFNGKVDRFITELCYFDDDNLLDGPDYFLHIQMLPWWVMGDAVPSRPILFK